MRTSEFIHNQYAKALNDHQQGRFNEACIGYLEILKWIPSSGSVWALIGTLMNQIAEPATGVRYLGRSLNIDPLNPATRSNLGNALREHNELALASAALKSSLVIQPEFGEAHINLGRVYLGMKDPLFGKQCAARALSIMPFWPEAYTALGIATSEAGLIEEAMKAHRASISIDPLGSDSYLSIGDCFLSKGRFDEAVRSFNRVIVINPQFWAAYLGRGKALHSLGKEFEAIANFDSIPSSEKSLILPKLLAHAESLIALGLGSEAAAIFDLARMENADSYDLCVGFARAFSIIGKHADALSQAHLAVALRPDYALAYFALADVLHEKGANHHALKNLHLAATIKNNPPQAAFNQSILKLKSGEFDAGWDLCAESFRNIAIGSERHCLDHKFCLPGFEGHRLWIWYENGFGVGDQIFFCSILDDIKNDFRQIIVSIDPRLLPIFQRSFPSLSFTSQRMIPCENYDGHIPMGNLPSVFRKFRGEARPLAYLRSNSQRTGDLRTSLTRKDQVICGLSWESKKKDIGAQKSLKLIDLLPILEMPNLKFVNLQYGEVGAQLDELQRNTGIIIHRNDAIDNFSDLDGLACLIDACDIVISTSNTTAHLAGALGKETYILAPSKGKAQLWYWVEPENHQSPWYPSLEVFQQSEEGDWLGPLREIQIRLGTKWTSMA